MPTRYIAAVVLTLALAALPPAAAKVPHHRHTARGTRPAPSSARLLQADKLYSRRALRQARTILELKLMELRLERLERVRKALEHHVPIDRLLEQDHRGGPRNRFGSAGRRAPILETTRRRTRISLRHLHFSMEDQYGCVNSACR